MIERWKCVGYCRHCSADEDDSTFSKEWGHFEKSSDGVWVRADAALALEARAFSSAPDPELNAALARIAALEARCRDYQEVLEDKRRLTRELDILLNGAGAAQQASLCDIISQVRSENIRSKHFTSETACEYGDACTLKYPHDKTAHVPETMGEHPGGGPCIHVWALTNRSAVENGKCELCGNSVETVVEHTSVCRCGHSDASHVRYVGECHFSDAIGQCICRSFTPKTEGKS